MDNAEKIDRLCRDTTSLVEAWETLGGALKFGIAVGKFAKWAGSFAVIVAIIDWLAEHGVR